MKARRRQARASEIRIYKQNAWLGVHVQHSSWQGSKKWAEGQSDLAMVMRRRGT